MHLLQKYWHPLLQKRKRHFQNCGYKDGFLNAYVSIFVATVLEVPQLKKGVPIFLSIKCMYKSLVFGDDFLAFCRAVEFFHTDSINHFFINLALHRVLTTRDATESIKYHSQSEESVGGLSLEAHCSRHSQSEESVGGLSLEAHCSRHSQSEESVGGLSLEAHCSRHSQSEESVGGLSLEAHCSRLSQSEESVGGLSLEEHYSRHSQSEESVGGLFLQAHCSRHSQSEECMGGLFLEAHCSRHSQSEESV